ERRVELEAPPDDLHLVGVLELRHGTPQAALADVAPRAHHIRPDLDGHGPVRGAHQHTPSVQVGASLSPTMTSPFPEGGEGASRSSCGSRDPADGVSGSCGVSINILTHRCLRGYQWPTAPQSATVINS